MLNEQKELYELLNENNSLEEKNEAEIKVEGTSIIRRESRK